MIHPSVNIALKAARAAGSVILRAMDRLDRLQIESKAENDFVTDIDRKAEEQVIYHLQKAFPDHAFVGEENTLGTNNSSDKAEQTGHADAEYEWVIDPIDGTTNFIRGIPHFAVSIACKHRGRLEHAVVYDPVRQEEFTATRGKGAQLNGKRIRVSRLVDLNGAVLSTGIPYRARMEEHLPQYMQSLETLAAQSGGIRRMGAATLDLAYVAAGRYEAFWEIGLAEWDMAAGALLVQEAGGLVSDFKGGPDYLSSGNIVAANPKCFKPVLQVVGASLGQID